MSEVVRLSEAAKASLPTHVAVIMDGNGRWAKSRGLPRFEGHRHGVESVRVLLRAGCEVGLKYLTLYAFSVENWNRPKEEVDTLMKFLARFLRSEIGELNRGNIRLDAIGQIWRLPEAVQQQLAKTKAATARNNGMTLILALSYGGRTELVEGVRQIAAKVRSGAIEPDAIDERVISEHLYTRNWPDPDLVIRSSGEMRVSNFLLWQASYAEFVATPTLWPDFRKPQFFEALEEYARRHRRFGGL
jgi:undecaprenyl diphosphate synthase